MNDQAISVTKKRGRPKASPTVVIRLPISVLETLDHWIEKQQSPKPSRPAAMRRILTERIKADGLLEK